ncbi:glycogen debranching protein GlgX [Ruania suaedae]|uniref:glycogen debranching protein GlgX n=1 Tax=Ruania suaedae TaxID=2897774 RepID=UPI001E36A7AE|nr:glycogen debranching protein GlgX [Ruania suaedae]UFU02099.1 glycogen debranching protein GlgX [Ruania suaedae]
MTTSAVLEHAAAPTAARRCADEPHRFGVHLCAEGVEVLVHAPRATAVDLCLLEANPDGTWQERRVRLHRARWGRWAGVVPGVRAGQAYGLRVHGPWEPSHGLWHNPDKLLLDPYARGVIGHVPLGVVLDDAADDAAHHPRTPWETTVVYEAHVRGLTQRLPGVPEHLRGTYAGLAHPETVAYLKDLGVTAVELLPIHAKVSEPALTQRGMSNYWGYNTLSFFAPEPSYATAAAQEAGPAAVLAEVKGMVSLLHEAGLEVILDVVYNHTCESGLDGPLVSWRGLDGAGYYLHEGIGHTRYLDVTGTGNSLDFRSPAVVRMALDSLRYWSQEVGVDGFRFDLAVTLGRRRERFEADHPFLVALGADPELARLKLIAEPWDIGPDGWRTGQFPAPMAEWNDRFRDAIRTFWIADAAAAVHGHSGNDLRDVATRLAGSADMFSHHPAPDGRGPVASINYVTAHDGFTLADLVAYDHKHNEANGEENRDGSDHNISWNHGVEGVTDDAEILAHRRRTMRNVLGTLLLASGTPMLTAGDELGRTQHGNNNAYCLDDESVWVDWDLAPWQEELLATTRHLLTLRREHPALRPGRFERPDPVHPGLAWYDEHGASMSVERWHDVHRRVLQMYRRPQLPEVGRDALVVINGAANPVRVTLTSAGGEEFTLVWDSAQETPPGECERADAGTTVTVPELSMRVYLSSPDHPG